MDFTRVKENLEKRGYQVSCFDTAAQAAAYLDAQIDGITVGFGGSVTLDQLGLYERLATHNQVIWHQHVPKGTDTAPIRREENAASIYCCSANALAETGELINIDGTGNRLASMLYGHEKIYYVIGENKIAPDYDAALWRARNIAAPRNAHRLGTPTPCAAKGDRCYNCQSPGRICRGLVVLWENITGQQAEVVLVHEELGY